MIYNLHLFNGSGDCTFSLNHDEKDENYTQLLYGFLYSLKSFTNRITPVLMKFNTFFTYSTSTYQLIFMELPTSLKIVLVVDSNSGKSNEYFKSFLREFYQQVYVEYVVKNPVISTKNDQIIESILFREKTIEYLNKL